MHSCSNIQTFKRARSLGKSSRFLSLQLAFHRQVLFGDCKFPHPSCYRTTHRVLRRGHSSIKQKWYCKANEEFIEENVVSPTPFGSAKDKFNLIKIPCRNRCKAVHREKSCTNNSSDLEGWICIVNSLSGSFLFVFDSPSLFGLH